MRSEPIGFEGGTHGCVATYVPKSNISPHQAVPNLAYYIRAGSSFVPTPHGVLAGMFGRRPQPFVFHNWAVAPATAVRPNEKGEGGLIHCKIELVIRNDGPGIASDLFISLNSFGKGGERCRLEFIPDKNRFSGNFAYGLHLGLIANPEVRLPPQSQMKGLTLDLILAPPFTSDLDISGIVGSAGAPPYPFSIKKSASQLVQLFSDFVAPIAEEQNGAGTRFVEILLGDNDVAIGEID